MDTQSQMTRSYGPHDQAEDPSIKIHHPEEEEHQEKGASKVLKKVKEKAKKIKNSLTKHGHGNDHDVEEEDDEHDEKDPEVYESSAVRGGETNVPVQEGITPPGTKVFPVVSSDNTRPVESETLRDGSYGQEAPSHPVRMSDREERREATSYPLRVSDSSEKGESLEAHQMPMNTRVSPLFATEDVTKTFAPGEDEDLSGQRKVNITDPTQQGSGEAGITESLGKMNVRDESSDQKPELGFERDLPTRSHDFSLKNESGIGKDSSTRSQEHDEKIESMIGEDPPTSFGGESEAGLGKDSLTRSHDEKIESIIREDSPTSYGESGAVLEREFPAKTESGIDKNSPTELGSDLGESEIQKPKSSTYTEKIASASSVIADKAIAAKNAVASKLGYTGESGGATSVIADKSIEAKNGVASKLGYTGESGGVKQESPIGDEAPKSATGYGQKVAGTLTPVYEKVKETGSNVMKKLPLSGGGAEEKTQQVEGYTGESGNVKQESPVRDETPISTAGYGQNVAETLTPVYEKVKETGSNVMKKLPLSGSGSEEKTQQGVSTRDYLAEKLRPGEEDKALSEMIAEKLNLGGGGEKKTREVEVTVEKIPSDQVTVEKIPSDQITEEKDYGESLTNEEKVVAGGGVVGKVKGAVASWLGGTTVAKSSDSVVSDSGVHVSEERRLQESGN